jgi:Bucentaur or craniofacial development
MTSPHHDADNDDEDDDEEYVPGKEKDEMEEDDDDNDDLPQQSAVEETYYAPSLTPAKRKAVDDAFEKLFGYKFGTSFLPVRKSRRTALNHNHKSNDKNIEILQDIFGPFGAAKIMALSTTLRPIKRLPLPASLVETITEVKHYAGQSIVVKRQVAVTGLTTTTTTAASTTAAAAAPVVAAAAPPPPPPPHANSSNSRGGLDTLLQELDGPSKLSTVAKTSADWDQFKTQEGLEDDLTKQAQGKNAFLQKKDFLQRVDARRFEVEKQVRDAERASRGK